MSRCGWVEKGRAFGVRTEGQGNRQRPTDLTAHNIILGRGPDDVEGGRRWVHRLGFLSELQDLNMRGGG